MKIYESLTHSIHIPILILPNWEWLAMLISQIQQSLNDRREEVSG